MLQNSYTKSTSKNPGAFMGKITVQQHEELRRIDRNRPTTTGRRRIGDIKRFPKGISRMICLFVRPSFGERKTCGHLRQQHLPKSRITTTDLIEFVA
ncbi:MAG: hypothetical protein M2R45_04220 [Verrucomicrobia subdivision 3 bacterium]|nr:hypothetical protein [Limisphaerales bacterium]MCS1417043.1 hypothetical protein [Limisphaerales bacterium]